jgi:NADPH2:quinone reductase
VEPARGGKFAVRAVSVSRFGGPEELRVAEVEPPRHGHGEVLIRIARAGINFIDVYMRNGSYARSHTYKTPLPMVIGMEGAGTVAALGAGVTELAVGDTVAYCLSRGSYAEYATVPAWRVSKVPGGVPLSIATALMLQGCTAHYLTHSAFPLAPGQTCLIHAGAGGVGQLVIQLAKLRGARVLTTVGSPDKAEIAKARGADACILYREQDFREEVMRLTDGRGVDVVYDSVGKDTIHRSIRSLRRRGVCILFGGSSGQVASVEPLELAEAGSVFFTRPHLADYTASADEIRGRTAELFKAWSDGKLKVTIDREIPLADAAEAHRILEGRGTRGKLLLQVS